MYGGAVSVQRVTIRLPASLEEKQICMCFAALAGDVP